MIPERQIEDILDRIDIVAFISRYVELKKSGRSFKGRCPFHEEKTPSFHVTPELRRFKCFGCQVGGDVIAFAQRYLGKSFIDAVRELAKEAGVDLEAAEDPSASERRRLKEVTDLAAAHFAARLLDPEVGRIAREYLAQRGIGDEASQTFGFGWAAPRWSDLSDKLMQAGVLEWGVAAGLVQPRSQGDGYYDVFRGRLIIPIRSPEGRTIAFGGRLLEGQDGPKYLNSRESLLYSKGETLYGMDQAREEIRRTKTAVLVEGYFDCIGLHQVGIKNAVALCSTALTAKHLSLLSRMGVQQLVLLLDGDEAGRKAVERLAGTLLAAGVSAKVALLPQGDDPDTFAKKRGQSGVGQLLNAALPLTEHLFNEVLPRGLSASFEEKMSALDRIRPVASCLSVGLIRSAFFASMGAHFGLPPLELEQGLRGKGPPVRPVPKPAPSTDRPPERLEVLFTACLLRNSSFAARDTYVVSDELRHPILRGLADALASGQTPEDALFDVSDPVQRLLENALERLPHGGAELEQTFEVLSRKMKLRSIDQQLQHIAQLAAQTEGVNDLSDETRRLQGERVDLLALKRKVLQEAAARPAPEARSELES